MPVRLHLRECQLALFALMQQKAAQACRKKDACFNDLLPREKPPPLWHRPIPGEEPGQGTPHQPVPDQWLTAQMFPRRPSASPREALDRSTRHAHCAPVVRNFRTAVTYAVSVLFPASSSQGHVGLHARSARAVRSIQAAVAFKTGTEEEEVTDSTSLRHGQPPPVGKDWLSGQVLCHLHF